MNDYDAVVVGGGIMGASAALGLAEGGMQVALFEARALGAAASGVNAGTLSIQQKRAALVPYALAGLARWRAAGESVGYRETGSVMLALTTEEASYLEARVEERRGAGAPIDLVTGDRVRELEPHLCENIQAASYCAVDGYANASLTGVYYRGLLSEAGVRLSEGVPVEAIEPGYRLRAGAETVIAKRLVLAGGAWLEDAGSLLGIALPITVRANIVSVTERMPPLLNGVVLHAFGRLTFKQKPNGTFLIGGGWQGEGHPREGVGRVIPESLIGNLRLAQHTLPALGRARLVRSWVGYEARAPDVMPLAGEIAGHPDAYVLGAVLGGYTIGPYLGKLVADEILGRAPERPLFPPSRFESTAVSGD